MRIYLNVSCLNRPFDDQDQARIRLESEAVAYVLDRCEQGEWSHVSSEMSRIESDAMPDRKRRMRVRLLLPEKSSILALTESVWQRGAALERLGFKPADAVHVAAAEALGSDVLLSCDDRFCRAGVRQQHRLKVRIVNPLDWLREIGHAPKP